jgi:RNA polymerase sigma-70 factor (ECF subfamily)
LDPVDKQLLTRAREQDAAALAEIYDRHSGSIYGYLYRFLGDPHHAEDLTSEVFCRLLQVLHTPRAPRDELRGWLYRVAHNLAMDWFRSQPNRATVDLDEQIAEDRDSLSAALEKRQMQQQLRTALRRLTEDQQRVILLRFGEGFSIAEVGQLMGKREGAIKILQHRAVVRLRKLLEQ